MTQISSTVTKALALFDEFLEAGPELTLSQLAARTRIHKTTILRLCASLERVGFLEREARTAYRIGPKIWQLAQIYRRNFRPEALIRPVLRGLRDQTCESVSFYVAEGAERICLFRENSLSVIRHHVDEGARLPLNRGVVGPVLMAFMGTQGPSFDKIRKDCYLVAQGREPHTASVAVPVLDGQGSLVGALVISGPSVRFDRQATNKALELLRAAAAKLGQALPYANEDSASAAADASAADHPPSRATPRDAGRAERRVASSKRTKAIKHRVK